MKPLRRAVIDIGTNSIKLLVGEVIEGSVHPIDERSEQTRLGAGFYDTHQLQPVPIARTASAVARFVAQARDAGAESIRIIATSAARDAENAADLLEAVRRAAGLRVKSSPATRRRSGSFAASRRIPACPGSACSSWMLAAAAPSSSSARATITPSARVSPSAAFDCWRSSGRMTHRHWRIWRVAGNGCESSLN